MPKLLTALRPIALGAQVIVEGQPYMPSDDQQEKELLASKRWRPQTKEDADAWAKRLTSDPVLSELLAKQSSPAPKGGKGKAEADAKAKAEAEEKEKAEAEEKEKAEAEAKAKVEADSKPGASTGAVGIG